jgi:hypothetical protein
MDELLASIGAEKELLDKLRPLPGQALAQLEDGRGSSGQCGNAR